MKNFFVISGITSKLRNLKIRTILTVSSIFIITGLILGLLVIFTVNNIIVEYFNGILKYQEVVTKFSEIKEAPLKFRAYEKDYFLNIGINTNNQVKNIEFFIQQGKKLVEDFEKSEELLESQQSVEAGTKIRKMRDHYNSYKTGFFKIVNEIKKKKLLPLSRPIWPWRDIKNISMK